VEVLDYNMYILLCSLVTQKNECETVQESVKVFVDLHRSPSFAREALCSPSLARMPLGQVLRRQPYEILSPIALRINVGLAFRSECSPKALGRLSANLSDSRRPLLRSAEACLIAYSLPC